MADRPVRDPDLYGEDATAERLLRDTDVWVVAGLSQNAERAAYGVARVLQSHGKRIIPVHPRAQTVHGEQGYATVEDASFSLGPIDVVECFVNSRRNFSRHRSGNASELKIAFWQVATPAWRSPRTLSSRRSIWSWSSS